MSYEEAYSLVRLCLTSMWSDTSQATLKAELKRGSISWNEILVVSENHSCRQLVCEALRDYDDVPTDVMEKLEKSYINCGSANLLYFHELENNLGNLKSAGIKCVLLKGAALAVSLYENIALRPMLDIDLLIDQADLENASQLFLALGYSQIQLNPQNSIIDLYENEASFGKKGVFDYVFELHWSLFNSPFYQARLPIEWFWQNLTSIKINQADLFVLNPEAQLLHLCGHLQLHHGGHELLWINDIAKLMVVHERVLDWEEIINKAQMFDLVLPLKLTIDELTANWQVFLANDIRKRIVQLIPSKTERKIFTRLSRPDRSVGIRFKDDLESLPSLKQKVRFAWTNLFPSIEYMTKHYQIAHPSLAPLYYIYRLYLGSRSLVSRDD